jgi:hypothetical protein
MRSLVSVVVGALLFVSAACACSKGTPAAITPLTVTLAGDGGATDTAAVGVAASDAPASPDGGPDFYSCGVDSDCIAVPKASCCPNGFLEAVNKQSPDAYHASFACGKHRLCPQFRVMDRRQALCSNESHRCEMVQPDKIVCNGTGANPHACPGGAPCDATGHCTVATPTPPTP